MIITGSVYMLIDCQAKLPFYVGSTKATIKERMGGHKAAQNHSTLPLYKYIRDNKIEFELEVIEQIELHTNRTGVLLFWEGYWIFQLRAWGFTLLNKTVHAVAHHSPSLKFDVRDLGYCPICKAFKSTGLYKHLKDKHINELYEPQNRD